MTGLAVAVLAGAVALVLYAYVGYPLLLGLFAPPLRRARRVRAAPPAHWPTVSIVIPVYNEARTIAATLESVLALDYPPERRQIVVVSDASTDATDDIVKWYAGWGVSLLRLPERRGKTAAENAACAVLRGDIVVNTDASVRVHPQAVKALVAAFADPTVGVASGRDVSVSAGAAGANAGEASYVGYEMWVRGLETRLGGIVGASGCLYAIRAALHKRAVPEALSRDFAAALHARERGYRAVSVPDALCFVPRSGSLRAEYHRKVRTIVRGLCTLLHHGALLNPARYGQFAWKLWSHKVCRWVVPWAVLAMGAAVAAPAVRPPWAWWLYAAAGVVALVSAAAWWWPEEKRLPLWLSVPAYAVFGSLACLHAWLRLLAGRATPTWEPTRREPARTLAPRPRHS